jgi:hypothetical protein
MIPLTRARRVLLALFILAAAILAPSAVFAQYRPDEIADRGFHERVLTVGRQVAAQYPNAWRNAHNAGEPAGSEFVRRWVFALRANGILACVNGKRGSDTLSQDVLTFPLTSGGAQDTSGRYHGRIAIVDVIVGAGGPNPSLGFGDVSEFAPGKCIEPFLDSTDTGTFPPVDPVTPPPVVTPPAPAPAPGVDLGPVLAELRALRAEVAELRARPDVTADLELVRSYLDDMVGSGPTEGEPNHVTDIKQREDKNRALLDEIKATVDRMARSRVFRF